MVAVSELVSGLDAELVRLGYRPSTIRSAPWPSNCNTHARTRTLKKPHNPCPRNGGRATGL